MPADALSVFRGHHFAHRGLWNASAPENSLPAFRRAADTGLGIELDVRLTRDGVPVIMHDASLWRMCGVNRAVEDTALMELRALRLAGTEAGIPTLREVLETIGGRVPVLIEVKKCRHVQRVCAAVTEMLADFPGACAAESFHPLAVRWFRRHAPQLPCGQLVFGGKSQHGRKAKLWAGLLLGLMNRPDFLACEAGLLSGRSLMRLRKKCGGLVLWTIRSQAEMDVNAHLCDAQIFEGFVPKR